MTAATIHKRFMTLHPIKGLFSLIGSSNHSRLDRLMPGEADENQRSGQMVKEPA